MESIIKTLEQTYQRIRLYLPEKKRLLHKKYKFDNQKGVIVYGGRGIGKTVLLLSKIENKNFLYFSADNPLVASIPFRELISAIFERVYCGCY
jgi:hypothetical protein